jgi:hypothetical protein
MAKTKEPKTRQRYSIGETYGTGFESLTSAQRFEGAKLAKTEFETRKLVGTNCPFQKKPSASRKAAFVQSGFTSSQVTVRWLVSRLGYGNTFPSLPWSVHPLTP